MDDKLKFRLVGAAVILAVMAFFLPLILDSEKYRTEIVPQIPAMPPVSESNSVSTELDQHNTKNTNRAVADNSGSLVIDLDKDIGEIEKQTIVEEVEDDNKVQNSIDEVTNAIENEKEPVVTTVTEQNKTKVLEKERPLTKTTIKTADKPVKKVEAKPVIPKIEKSKEPVKKDPVKKEIVKKEVKPIIPAKAPDFKEKAYVIQIGTFSNKDNASKLVNDLRSQEYRAYQRISDNFSRVFVGPYPDKSIADKRSTTLSKIVANKVKVLEFDPIKH